MTAPPVLAMRQKLIASNFNVSPMRACTDDGHAWSVSPMRVCTDDGHAWTRNASEIDCKQLAMCRQCAHALMTVTPGFAMHQKLIASNLRCVANARMH